MKKWIQENAAFTAWTLSGVVSALAILIWLEEIDWEFSELTLYTLFPLLGILAFSLMWTHYSMYALRIYAGYKAELTKQYFTITSAIVLASILLHPGLLITQLYIDGHGLPPESYKSYVAASSIGFVYLGVVSLIIFLLFELHGKYGKKPWWKFISAANAIAMFLIYVHANELGSHVGEDWFSIVWSFYGVSLLASYIYLAYKRKLI